MEELLNDLGHHPESENEIGAKQCCDLSKARYLTINDLKEKLTHPGEYEIGGVYSPDLKLWFYYTTIEVAGLYLLNLFVCCVSTGSYIVRLNSTSKLSMQLVNETPTDEYSINGKSVNECCYLKTYTITESDLKKLYLSAICIPIVITNPNSYVGDPILLSNIKINHMTSFSNQVKKSDKEITLESSSGQVYKVHKIFIAAHNPKIREMLKTSKTDLNYIKLNLNDECLELMLHYIYTGTVGQITEDSYLQFLEMALEYGMESLSLQLQKKMLENINVSNALSLGLVTERLPQKCLQENVFQFIKEHPEVMDTSAWNELDKTSFPFVKKLLKFIHNTEAMMCLDEFR